MLYCSDFITVVSLIRKRAWVQEMEQLHYVVPVVKEDVVLMDNVYRHGHFVVINSFKINESSTMSSILTSVSGHSSGISEKKIHNSYKINCISNSNSNCDIL